MTQPEVAVVFLNCPESLARNNLLVRVNGLYLGLLSELPRNRYGCTDEPL